MKYALLPLVFLFPHALLGAQTTELENHWDFGLGAGATIPDLSDSHASSGEGWPDDAYPVDNMNAAAIFSAFAGYTFETQRIWFPAYSVRLNYLYSLSSQVTGDVEQFSLEEFDNYKYQYDVQSQALLALLKLPIQRYDWLVPFISAGAGVAWNQFSSYSEEEKNGVTARMKPDFDDHTQTSFAFLVGAGFDFLLSESFSITTEYNYADLGNVSSDQDLTADLTTNILLLSISYAL